MRLGILEICSCRSYLAFPLEGVGLHFISTPSLMTLVDDHVFLILHAFFDVDSSKIGYSFSKCADQEIQELNNVGLRK
jgi:hypothetical protein